VDFLKRMLLLTTKGQEEQLDTEIFSFAKLPYVAVSNDHERGQHYLISLHSLEIDARPRFTLSRNNLPGLK